MPEETKGKKEGEKDVEMKDVDEKKDKDGKDAKKEKEEPPPKTPRTCVRPQVLSTFIHSLFMRTACVFVLVHFAESQTCIATGSFATVHPQVIHICLYLFLFDSFCVYLSCILDHFCHVLGCREDDFAGSHRPESEDHRCWRRRWRSSCHGSCAPILCPATTYHGTRGSQGIAGGLGPQLEFGGSSLA